MSFKKNNCLDKWLFEEIRGAISEGILEKKNWMNSSRYPENLRGIPREVCDKIAQYTILKPSFYYYYWSKFKVNTLIQGILATSLFIWSTTLEIDISATIWST